MQTEIKNKLLELAEDKYQKFAAALLPNVDNILGVRLPLLRKLAREIANGDWRSYLVSACNEADRGADSEYLEEVMLQGMVIGYVKADVEETLHYVADFIPKIDNWSVCDSFCAGLKFTKHHKERVWDFLQPYFASRGEYELRFGIVMLLNFYIEERYIDRLLLLLDNVEHEGYYVKMAVAWAVSICFVKLPEPTMEYLKRNNLNDFSYNKTLQKIIESNRVDTGSKDLIRTMKRK